MKPSVIVVGDIHISGKNPISRKDDLVELQFTKLNEIISLANDLDIDIISVGDVTHVPNISYSIFNCLVKELKKLNNFFYFVIGQHDIFWHTKKTFQHTALGAIENSLKNVKHISKFNDINMLYGYAYEDWGEPIKEENQPFFISHRPVITRKNNHVVWIKENPEHVRQFADLDEYELILCGDWHKPYDKIINTFNRKRVLINPGCLCRRDANEDNQHMPSVVMVDFETLEYERYYLKCAKEYEEIISESHLELGRAKKEISKSIDNILSTIKQTINRQGISNFLNLLTNILFDDSFEDDLKEEVRSSLHRVYGDNMPFEIITNRPKLKERK